MDGPHTRKQNGTTDVPAFHHRIKWEIEHGMRHISTNIRKQRPNRVALVRHCTGNVIGEDVVLRVVHTYVVEVVKARWHAHERAEHLFGAKVYRQSSHWVW